MFQGGPAGAWAIALGIDQTEHSAAEVHAVLVLTRKPGESIVIGDEITITIIEASGGRVRLGIEAPREVGVHRAEIYQAIRREILLSDPAVVGCS